MNIIIEEIVSEFPVVITEEVVQIEISESVSYFNVVISESVSYFDIEEVSDNNFVNKDGFVPTVDEALGKMVLKEPTGGATGNAGGDLGGTYPNPTVPALANKVDKVAGKSLISDTEIDRLALVTNFDNSDNIEALSNKADLVDGFVSSSQLPSFVDDVVEGYLSGGIFYNEVGLITVISGAIGKIYVDLTSGQSSKQYRWTGAAYIQITNGLIASTNDVPEGVNLYFTTARVLATLLTGVTFATSGEIVSTDSVLIAFGKIQKQITDLLATGSRLITNGEITKLTNTSGTNTGDDATNSQYSGLSLSKEDVDNKTSIIAGNTTNSTKYLSTKGVYDYIVSLAYLTIASASSTYQTLLSFAGDVRATVLTGFSSSAGTVTSSDTILSAFNKIVGNVSANTTALASTKKILYSSGAVQSYVTGVTAVDTQILKITIPANTLAADSYLNIDDLVVSRPSGQVGNIYLYAKMSTSNTMPSAGVDDLGFYIIASSTRLTRFKRNLWINGGNIKGMGFTVNTAADGTTSNAMGSKAFNVTVTNYLYFSVYPFNSADSIRLEAYQITN